MKKNQVRIESPLFEMYEAVSPTSYPKPFECLSNMTVCINDGRSIRLPAAFMKAAIAYIAIANEAAGNEVDERFDRPYHVAVGTRTADGEEETVYVEWQQTETDPLQAIEYNPETGEVKGALAETIHFTPEKSVWTYAPGTAKDCSALWLAILFAAPGSLLSNYYLNAIDFDYIVNRTVSAASFFAEEYADYRARLFGEQTPIINLAIGENKSVKRIDYNKVVKGKIGPQKRIYGDFKFFVNAAANGTVSFDPKRYENIPWVRSYEQLSPEERLLVPEISPEHIVTQYQVDVLEDFLGTANKSYERRLSNILLVGQAGTGKSQAVMFWAGALKRPLVTFTFSAYTTEDDIKGTVMMKLENDDEFKGLSVEEQALYKVIMDSKEEMIIDAVAKCLGLPTTASCYFDPVDSFERITGTPNNSVDAQQARDALEDTCTKKIRALATKVSSIKGGESGVSYRYIPSPIVRAIENGYMLELQEPSNVLQQGVLSALYDVLEKASVGTLTLPHKTAYRHPDFVCVMTTNTDYPGCKPLSPALISRMQEQITVEEPSKEELVQRVIAKTGMRDITLATKVVDVYKRAAEVGRELGSIGEATPRSLYNFAEAVDRGVEPMSAFKRMLLGAITFNRDDQLDVLNAVEGYDLFA